MNQSNVIYSTNNFWKSIFFKKIIINSFYSNDTSVPLTASAAVLYQRGRYKSLKHI